MKVLMKHFYFFLSFFIINELYSDPLLNVVNNFQYSTFKANLEIQNNNSIIRGVIHYQQGKFNFKIQDGRIIAADGRRVFIYDPDTRVSGKQEIIPSGGISWILNYPKKIEQNSAIIEPPGGKPYQKILLYWNEKNFPTTIQFYKEKNYISYRFSNIVFLNNIQASLFSYKAPAGSRNVDNPLNLKK